MNIEPEYLSVGNPPRRIAIRTREGTAPGLFWLGGFKSDMKGTKAVALDQHAAKQGRACIRFDYSGHGESSEKFEDGTISKWLEDALAVFGTRAKGPQIVVGSSMGGWMALLLARALAKDPLLAQNAKLAGLVLIAPAPDFTEELMWKQYPPAARRAIEQDGRWTQPSDYDPAGYVITRRFIEDGRFGAYVRTMRGVYAERLDALEAAVTARLPHVLTPDRPVGGLQMPCFLKDGFDEAETVRAARRVGVHLTGLTPLHDAGAGRPGWLMGFAASTPTEIDAAVDRLAKLFPA